MDVFNINDLIYKVNVNTTSDTSNQQTMEYKDVLDKIRHIISKNHSAELIDVIYSPSAGDKLKNLIIRYLNIRGYGGLRYFNKISSERGGRRG